MVTLYVTSTEPYSGKTGLCVGLGRRFLADGFSLGYMKPVSLQAKSVAGRIVDEDAEFIKKAFDLPEPMETLVPVGLTQERIEAILRGTETTDFEARLKEAFAQVAKGRDIVLLEGGTTLREGYIVHLSTPYVAELLTASELVVIRYSEELVVDDALTAQARLGDSMLGVVINVVPRPRMEFAETVIRPFLERRGVRVFGILPQERLLQSISVRELADCLGGETLCCPDRLDDLVEHLMVGAMSVDSALTYFRRKPNKAVITGGDRPDIQLAALETSTRCLILTGNLQPSAIILSRAEELGVPVIVVPYDTLTTVEIIERFFGKTRFHQEKKIARLMELLELRFDFQGLYEALRLKSRE
ncbi:MAG: phosphotransacetylase family protein [Anaerolineae bacterium]